VILKRAAANVGKGGVDAVAEVLSRIDEGAVKVEDKQFEALDWDWSKDVDHGSSVAGKK
jgi:hypothetical protein